MWVDDKTVVEQRECGLGIESGQTQFGQGCGAKHLRLVIADSEQQQDALGLQSACDECQRVGRRTVEPLRIVDDAQHRLCLGDVGEQAQDAERHQESFVAAPRAHTERRFDGGALLLRDIVEVRAYRPQQLLDGREGELRLGFDAGAAQNLYPSAFAAASSSSADLPIPASPRSTSEPL